MLPVEEAGIVACVVAAMSEVSVVTLVSDGRDEKLRNRAIISWVVRSGYLAAAEEM